MSQPLQMSSLERVDHLTAGNGLVGISSIDVLF